MKRLIKLFGILLITYLSICFIYKYFINKELLFTSYFQTTVINATVYENGKVIVNDSGSIKTFKMPKSDVKELKKLIESDKTYQPSCIVEPNYNEEHYEKISYYYIFILPFVKNKVYSSDLSYNFVIEFLKKEM